MKIIADSSSTRTEWVLADGDKIVEHVFTEGLNPYFQTRKEISHSIRLNLPDAFFRRRWEHIYFYGAGCANPDRNKVIEASLVAQFRTPVTVMSDLLGAARGLFIDKPGLPCILGTGSNSCIYDGEEIVDNVKSLGFILGDEGSGAYIGKAFFGDCLKGIAPKHVRDRFFEESGLTPEEVMDSVYSGPFPNRWLSQQSARLATMLDDPYVYQLVYASLMKFFTRNVLGYRKNDYSVSLVGSVACLYEDIVRKIAQSYGIHIEQIVKSSMPGLIKYHNL